MAVTFTLTPECARRRTNSIDDSRRVLVTGILTYTFSAQLRDLVRLPLHLRELVRKHLEGNGLVGHGRKNLVRERLVVFHAGRTHQRRVGRKTLDQGIGLRLQYLCLISAIGKQLDFQFRDASHRLSVPFIRIQLTASVSDVTRKSGAN